MKAILMILFASATSALGEPNEIFQKTLNAEQNVAGQAGVAVGSDAKGKPEPESPKSPE